MIHLRCKDCIGRNSIRVCNPFLESILTSYKLHPKDRKNGEEVIITSLTSFERFRRLQLVSFSLPLAELQKTDSSPI